MRILIVEDEVDLAEALARGLRRQGYAVDVVHDGAQGCEAGQVNDYDLVLLDLSLPGMDGMEVCRRLRAARPEALILMLTARFRSADKIAGLDAGADDYMVKPFDFGELLARIRALFRRDRKKGGGGLLEWGDIRLDPVGRTVWVGTRRVDLTRKEFGVLEYPMRHPGEIVSPVLGAGPAETRVPPVSEGPPPVSVPVILDGVLYPPEEFNKLQNERYPKPVYLIACGMGDGSMVAFSLEEKWDAYALDHGLPTCSEMRKPAEDSCIWTIEGWESADGADQVRSDYVVSNWEHINYGGSGFTVAPGGVINNLGNLGWDNRISSVEASYDYCEILFDYPNPGYPSFLVLPNVDWPNLHRNGWGDRASSWRTCG